jgi:hypothetical protein
VRFEVTAPFSTSGYCHCTHCQRRTGTGSSVSARVPRAGFRFLQGEQQVKAYKPPAGLPKLFCSRCGSALFSGDPSNDDEVAIRFGTLDRDPGIRPKYRMFVRSAVPWEEIPDDGLERFTGLRDA